MHVSEGAAAVAAVVAIDGRSGSGKSRLADRLSLRSPAQILHMDGLYPGWGGLAEGSRTLVRVLQQRAGGEIVRVRQWDWVANKFRDGVLLRPDVPLIVEGCGSLTRASAPLLTASVWLDAPEDLRRRRATERDSDDTWWDGWMRQEAAFYAREQSPSFASIRLDATQPGTIDVDMLCQQLDALGWPGAAH